MSLEEIFACSGLLVLPFWILMAFLPHWRWTKRIIGSPLISLPAALLYAGLVLPQLGAIWSAVSSPELGAIATLLGSPAGATIAWVHFLAFDLFVGRWVYLDSRARGVSALLMAPVLLLVLMLGPIGFALYLGLRALYALRSNQVPAPAAL
ncbi:MAG: DUF4281 domain-containing protein [Roseiflexaceae bacterium]|nr:DUF4281 domain-containing protein [Roseiflexaceae bacterium]